ncbi:TPA: hypothetical protein H1012_01045 [archaeon]|nr:hypothetical protein [Candidatus Naiadarchaeales archaeon SRR2090159.bin1288]
MESKLILAFILIGVIVIAGCAGEKAADTGTGEQDTGTTPTGGEVDVDTSDPLAGSEGELTEVENI